LRVGEYLPLLLDKDPRTSLLSVLVDNRTLRMGEAGGFSLQTEKTSEGARFVWRSSSLEIIQLFSFVKTREASLVDGVKMQVRLKNLGDKTVMAAVRLLLDTYLGEKGDAHFATPRQPRISGETLLKPATDEPYWLSAPAESGDQSGLQFMLVGEGVNPPEEVILANWKRLNDAPWKLNVSAGRNFNLLPYSINDSAASVFYAAEALAKGETREITALFGNRGSGQFAASAGPSGISTILQQATKPQTAPGENSIKTDLLTVENLIEKINELLKREKAVTDDELVLLRQVVEEMSKRKSQQQAQ
jgi:hypothetical protein